MEYIKNSSTLKTSASRKIALDLIEAALSSIQPENIMSSKFSLNNETLQIDSEKFNLNQYERVFLIGFGKGSAGISQIIEGKLGERLSLGYDIDTVEKEFAKVSFVKGTHPLPSQANIDFTNKVLENIKDLNEKDLVLVVICGGGSALFESPNVTLDQLDLINKELLDSGATISEINTIRKHLSKVKGGGLAKHLYPAKVVSMIFSDVPGNDLSVIASAPTVKNETSFQDAKNVIAKYSLKSLHESDLTDTPGEEEYFSNVLNIIMVSNMTALQAMEQAANKYSLTSRILTDKFEGNAKDVGKTLIEQTKPGEILLIGGETTVHVTGNGRGGRNQTLVLAALEFVNEKTLICSFDSDGWDFEEFAGAIGDSQTLEKAKSLGLDINSFLDNDNSSEFFEKTEDGILTGRLSSNVSDLIFVIKNA